jgi:N-methylhydantoinase A
VLEHPLTTIQVPPGWRLRADEWGNYVLTDTPKENAR